MQKPEKKPERVLFSSGPCAKRPGWSTDALSDVLVGRSHRSAAGKAKLAEVIERTREVLGIPDTHRIGIVPASDTGAVEMALWSLLGPRPVDCLVWESFSRGWATDITKQLKLENRILEAPYGQLPDLGSVDFARDVVFAWNGTTSGVRVPNADWIPADREGLTICDATSAVFAMDVDFDKLDAVTWSWQKVLGGEAAHGMLVLSPRAVARLESHTPAWPMPKIFRMTKGGKLIEGIFKGATINTPSMLCVEDVLDSLRWAEQVGGLPGMIERSQANLAAIEAWIESSSAFEFLAAATELRSSTSICLKFSETFAAGRDQEALGAVAKKIVKRLEDEGVALDLGAYRDAPAGLRLWGGATVSATDTAALLPWLDWAASLNS
jgi:phosphoserine aminotransferase